MKQLLWLKLGIISLLMFPFPGYGQTATLRGRVTDAVTGEPIAKVKVLVVGTGQQTTTAADGTFVLPAQAAGEIELYITTVGYGLVKKRIALPAGETLELQIALNQEAAPLRDAVTVNAGAFNESETNAASSYSLDKPELRALSTVLVADPLRAAQGLPGVVGNDDFRSDFILRGAGFRRVGFFIDGIQLPENPAHTINGDADAGQISILNADTISAVSLLSGAYPSRYGDNTAGVLQLDTRDGNRVKPAGRLAASLLSSSAVFDGPIAGKRGAWLVAARKSYLQYLLNGLSDDAPEEETFAIDFTDAQAKAVYDLTPRHQIGVTGIRGNSRFNPDQSRTNLNPNDLVRSKSDLTVLYASWNYNGGPRFTAQNRFFGQFGEFINQNPAELTLLKGESYQWGLRSDLAFLIVPTHRLETGAYLRRLQGRGAGRLYSPAFRQLVNFDERGAQQGYYAQDTWSSNRLKLALTGGVRFDHTSLTGETVVTPRAALNFAPLENTRIRLGWGQYTEFPNFGELYGARGAAKLRAERATHYNLSIEHLFNDQTRLVVETYQRTERNLLFSLNDTVVRGGQTTFICFPFTNSLSGYARGFELSLHRRSANRLTGWLSYSFATTALRDRVTNFRFVSDFDQRHTVSTYGSYRLTDTFNLSAQWRYGSGLPLVGFYQFVNARVVAGAERNRLRLPAYSRLDLRVNKAFYFKRSKLTLSGEVLNLLGRDNYRQDGRNREKLLPLLPSVGVAFEF